MTTPTIDSLDLPARVRRILTGPPGPDKRSGQSNRSAERIYRMAARIRQAAPHDAPLCLGCASREVIAAALLASLAGAPPLLLPPDFGLPVLADLHRTTGFKALVTTDRDAARPPSVRVIDPSAPGSAPSLSAGVEARGRDEIWAYLFTGGSTGSPQCWSKTVGNLLGEAAFQAARLALTPADVVLATVPGHHIYGLLFTVLAPWLAGARVVSATPSFPAEIAAALAAEKATVLVSVPAHYRLLAGHLDRKTTLRLALSSAGPLPEKDGAAFTRATGVELEEVYGSTETGGIATRRRARGEGALTPFAGMGWQIEDGHLKVRSPFLSPELPRDARGYFRTADQAAAEDPDAFVVLGRSDGVVKIGGRRVDLEAVRRQILAIEGVGDAFVFVRPAPGGRQNDLLALVQGPLEPVRIRARLQADSAPWSVPRTIRTTDRIPMAATGKVDRRAIEALFEEARSDPEAGAAEKRPAFEEER